MLGGNTKGQIGGEASLVQVSGSELEEMKTATETDEIYRILKQPYGTV